MTSVFSFTSSSNATCKGTNLFMSCSHVGEGPNGGIGASTVFLDESFTCEILIPKQKII